MAPDRGRRGQGSGLIYRAIGDSALHATVPSREEAEEPHETDQAHEEEQEFLARQASSDTNFTARGVAVGSIIGILICFSNTYFGLQTGWVSGMGMPASLIGFAVFKTFSRCLSYPFTPVEHVLVQTVAGAVGTMPLGAGFVGVIPALNYLLKPEENGPISIGIGKLIVWSVGICFFGVFVAVPLRKEVIIREKLRFPSGTATALMIRVLHGKDGGPSIPTRPSVLSRSHSQETRQRSDSSPPEYDSDSTSNQESRLINEDDKRDGWKSQIRLLTAAFAVAFLYILASYFIPQLHDVPIFGTFLADRWVWTLNPSPAYVGQGIIMGTSTSMHMLFGAILGWAVLSPIAKSNGWAPGPVGDWTTGSKGWIVWVSLAIMLADTVMNLGWLILKPTIQYGPLYVKLIARSIRQRDLSLLTKGVEAQYAPLTASTDDPTKSTIPNDKEDAEEADAPPEHQASNLVVYPGFALSILVCVAAIHITFPSIIPIWASFLAVFISLLLSLMGVRALGETDLNPVSGYVLSDAPFFPGSWPKVLSLTIS